MILSFSTFSQDFWYHTFNFQLLDPGNIPSLIIQTGHGSFIYLFIEFNYDANRPGPRVGNITFMNCITTHSSEFYTYRYHNENDNQLLGPA